ncbi:nickel-binding protein [Aegicerativicinus sediminis]|uniref:nickel-binding protein n=1 Tax=Aegicerativicinus sediminis TaxID=2893202 RepID=UPI001E56C5E8|nr:nickel-binding protein [Aegicerativicinus sediminis]
MPIYMDLHIGQGLTSEDVALAHQLDLKYQDKFQCRCLTYWVDENKGSAYCLIEAPSKESVIALHNHAHSQLPDEIIEVDKRVVKIFLGRLHDPIIADYMVDSKIKVFHDPAHRVILKMAIIDSVQLSKSFGKAETDSLLNEIRGAFTEIVTFNSGCPAEWQKWNYLGSFLTTTSAIQSAKTLFRKFDSLKDLLQMKFVIHAGNPVDNHPNFFGKTLDALPLMGQLVDPGYIALSHTANTGMSEELETNNIIILSDQEEHFIVQLSNAIHNDGKPFNTDLKGLMETTGMSQSSFYRKMVSIFHKSPNIVIQDFLLNQSKLSLLKREGTVTEIAFKHGFNSPSYFSKCFTKKFGISPSEFLK